MSNYDAIKKMFEHDIYCFCPAIEELLKLSPDLWGEVENLEDEDGEWKEICAWFRVSVFLYTDLQEKEKLYLNLMALTIGEEPRADSPFIWTEFSKNCLKKESRNFLALLKL